MKTALLLAALAGCGIWTVGPPSAWAAADPLTEIMEDLAAAARQVPLDDIGTPEPSNQDLAATLSAGPAPGGTAGTGSRPPLPPPPTVVLSDSFDRPAGMQRGLGPMDRKYGGSDRHGYLPIFANGAEVVDGVLANRGADFGGVQIAATTPEGQPLLRGEDLGQSFHLRVDLLVPGDGTHVSCGGPYFRSRAAAAGDGIIGGASAGYWVQLVSTGQVRIKRLNPHGWIAVSGIPPRFDSRVFHTLEIRVQGNSLEAALDGQPVSFQQAGAAGRQAAIPATAGDNQGTVGIAFGSEDNRGQIGGQRADNLILYRPGPGAQAPPFRDEPRK